MKEQQELIDRMTGPAPAAETTAPVSQTPPTPSSAVTSPAAGWSPTHEVKRPAQAWVQPDPNGAVVGTLERGLSVQVIARHGEWARVLCLNGWSGWIDGRDLKER